MKLVLGSASWRANYGSFSKGKLSINEISDLVNRAGILGFHYIDTAPSYGDTEEILGSIKLSQSIATKVTIDPLDFRSISKSIDLSRRKLGVELLDLVFIHNWDILSEYDKLKSVDEMHKCLESASINRWGISTYEVHEILKLQNNGWSNLTVQINASVLDQRLEEFISNQDFNALKILGVEIWVRSIFLQGILLNQTSDNPFINNEALSSFFDFCTSNGYSPIEICLAYVKHICQYVNGVVLGIDSLPHLNQISRSLRAEIPDFDFSPLNSRDEMLVDPRRWDIIK